MDEIAQNMLQGNHKAIFEYLRKNYLVNSDMTIDLIHSFMIHLNEIGLIFEFRRKVLKEFIDYYYENYDNDECLLTIQTIELAIEF